MRYFVGILFVLGFAVGCAVPSGPPSSAGLPRAAEHGHASGLSGFTVLYQFSYAHLHAGLLPFSGLVYANGYLWGTTITGGQSCNCGTVYAIHESGGRPPESFGFSRTNGAHPFGDLTFRGGLLYGTTAEGGDNDGGTVFSIDPNTGAETVLESALAKGDPHGNVAFVPNFPKPDLLWYTNQYGFPAASCPDARGCGSIKPQGGGAFSFSDPNLHDWGRHPRGNLAFLRIIYKERPYSYLFGVTRDGSYPFPGDSSGIGTVFAVPIQQGARTKPIAIANFSGSEGTEPAGVIAVAPHTIYGTTHSGGSHACPGGCGVVFSLEPRAICGQPDPAGCLPWTKRVIHTFAGGTDGANPLANVVDVNGKLYGTTTRGGGGPCTDGCGTVFEVDPNSGAERVLHAFSGGEGGSYPTAAVTAANGVLYGTTLHGGSSHCTDGCGTVFALPL